MNGAESLVKTLLEHGVDTCFANPGTSEMHFVAALDAHPDMRCVLCLFGGGTTGAADAYFRMSGKVGVTLLHLAPGFGNAYANAHNARKAGSGMLNVVGDHATYHLRYESPLKGDIEGVTRAVSHWVRASQTPGDVARDAAAGVLAAENSNGQIATLILPADTAWGDATDVIAREPAADLRRPSEDAVTAAADALRQPGAVLFVGGAGLYGEGAELAGRIAAKTGARLMCDFLVARLARGEGAVAIEKMKYVVDENRADLADTKCMVLCGAGRPVAFFAYPGKPSTPEPANCALMPYCDRDMDVVGALRLLAEATGALDTDPVRVTRQVPVIDHGPLTAERVGQVLAHHLPDNAIIANEGVTNGRVVTQFSATAAANDELGTTGGAIGQGLPSAVGAAVACPDRRVVCLTGDGSAMYTIQSLWTMAREQLDVTVLVFSNRGYQILRGELANLGVTQVGRNAVRMFDVEDPEIDWIAMARGHGVQARRAETTEELAEALSESFATPGPRLIDMRL